MHPNPVAHIVLRLGVVSTDNFVAIGQGVCISVFKPGDSKQTKQQCLVAYLIFDNFFYCLPAGYFYLGPVLRNLFSYLDGEITALGTDSRSLGPKERLS